MNYKALDLVKTITPVPMGDKWRMSAWLHLDDRCQRFDVVLKISPALLKEPNWVWNVQQASVDYFARLFQTLDKSGVTYRLK